MIDNAPVLGQHELKEKPYFKYNNSIQAEFFGTGLTHLSLHYEATLLNSRRAVYGQIGASYFWEKDGRYTFTFPVSISKVLGKGPDHFEYGLGLTYLRANIFGIPLKEAITNEFLLNLRLGFRHQHIEKRAIVRAYVLPMYNFTESNFLFGFGLSCGLAFNKSN